jgi:hypothetical protein
MVLIFMIIETFVLVFMVIEILLKHVLLGISGLLKSGKNKLDAFGGPVMPLFDMWAQVLSEQFCPGIRKDDDSKTVLAS